MSRRLGKYFEDAAKEFLLLKKFAVKECNFFAGGAEIDIIAQKHCYMYFIEVKSRKHTCGYEPYEAVDKNKRAKIKKAAFVYLSGKEKKRFVYMLGIISIKYSLQWLELRFFEDEL